MILPRPAVAMLIVLLPSGAVAQDALVAVAANYASAAEAVAEAFAQETGFEVQITTGSTGKLYAQIAQNAPFDVMLSADRKTPERIEAEGLGVAGSRFTYAIGRLSLWSPDADRITGDPAAALLAEDTLFIAIANPDIAPYGVAAQQAMEAMGVWQQVQPKIVMGQNIGQTFSLTDTGAAQVGFVATSAIEGPGIETRGSRHDIPEHLFDPIEQDAILLIRGQDNPAAVAFVEYLRGDAAKAIAQSFGYGTR